MTEFYIGLATLQAAVMAVFLAGLLVLIQMAAQSFSLSTPHLILRQWSLRITVAFSGFLVVAALAAAIRAAFPNFEALPGYQHSDELLNSAWPAVGLTAAVVASLAADVLIFVNTADALRGPGLLRGLVTDVRPEEWVEWIEFVQPEDGSLPDVNTRERYRSGDLADPLAPIFEVAAVASQGGRFQLLNRTLLELRLIVAGWQELPEPQRPDSHRTVLALLPHLNSLMEGSASSRAENQSEAIARSFEGLAVDAVSRHDGSSAVRLSYELATWATRFREMGASSSCVAAVRSLRSVALQAADENELDAFCDSALALGKVGEEIALHLKDAPPTLLPAGFTEARYDSPLSSFQEAMGRLCDRFTRHPGLIGRSLNVRLFLDSLGAPCRAFLVAAVFGEQADAAAAQLLRRIGEVGIAGAKENDKDAVGMTLYAMEKLMELPNAQWGLAREFVNSVAYRAFEIGLYAEARPDRYAEAFTRAGTECRDRFARLCALAGDEAFERAEASLYKRGHTSYAPDEAHEAFFARAKARPEWRRGGGPGGPVG